VFCFVSFRLVDWGKVNQFVNLEVLISSHTA